MKLFLLAALLGVSGFAFAQDQPSTYTKRKIAAVETKTPPAIDGDLGDEVWKTAPQAVTFVDRVNNTVVTDQTTAYIVYDEKFIYIAYHAIDSEPSKVEARETQRDSKYAGVQPGQPVNREDNVTVAIDCYYSKKPLDQCVFSVNALGTPSVNIASGRGGKLEWKGNWDSAAKRTADGYTVEIRIPWAMLNYPSGARTLNMGIDFYRFQYRNKLESVWSNVGPYSHTELEGIWTGVHPPRAAFRPRLSLLPYVLPGVREDQFTFRSGVDAKATLTPDLTAVGSLNPDFNTIEGAVEGISFSRQERFVPERRPFFLEGSNYFGSGTQFNDIGAFFYARRIPTFDLGTKIYGKVTPVDSVGLLNTITFGRRMDTVFQYHRDITDTSSAGVFLSNKSSALDNNSVAVVDGHARMGAFSLETQVGKSWGTGAGGGLAVFSGNYQKKNNITLLQYHTVSQVFRAADGFIPYTDYHGFYAFTDFNSQWRKGFWRSYDYGAYGLAWDHQDGRRYQRDAGMFGSLVARGDWSVGLSQDYAVVDNQIDSTVTLSFRNGVSNRFKQYGISVQTGRLASKPATFIAPSASIRFFKGFDVSYAGSLLNLEGVTKQHILTANYELSPTRSFGGRLVSQDHDTNWYVSFRNSGGKGTDLYLILGDPNARKFRRQFQMKLVFAL